MKPYYEDDWVTLYHGNCLEITEWLAADVLVTDPPYGRDWKQGELKGHFTANRSGIANDTTTSARDAALKVWGDGRAILFGDLMLAPPAGTRHVLIYRKPSNAGLRGAVGGYRRDCEAIYLIGPGHGSGIGGDTSVLTTSAAKVGGTTGLGGRFGHPHEKPQDVMALLLMGTTGVVADPFAGSGSTLDERHCEIAARRLAQDAFDFGGAA